jgi:hypothetical protein
MTNPYENKFYIRQAQLRAKIGLPPEAGISPEGAIVKYNPEPGVAEALGKIGLAYILTKKPPVGSRLSWADRQQERIVKLGNFAARTIGAEKSDLALPENIAAAAGVIETQYLEALGERNIGKLDLIRDWERKVIDVAGERYRAVVRGEEDGSYETTDDERAVAYDLAAKLGFKTARQIREILDEHVQSRTRDIGLAETGNALQSLFVPLDEAMKRLQAQRPKVLFYPDWITSNLVMDREEQEELENTSWGIAPTSLYVGGIGQSGYQNGMPDFRNYKIADIRPGEEATEGIVLQRGVPSSADLIRRKLTRLFQPTVNSIYDRLDVGEIVTLQDYDRDRILAQFAVRNAGVTIGQIARIGRWARDFEAARELSKAAIRGHEAAYRFPIRPNKVIECLPQGDLVREIDFCRNRDGSVDYDTPIQNLLTRKQELENALFQAALEAAPWIDANGRPTRKKDEITLRGISRVIGIHEDQISRLRNIKK